MAFSNNQPSLLWVGFFPARRLGGPARRTGGAPLRMTKEEIPAYRQAGKIPACRNLLKIIIAEIIII